MATGSPAHRTPRRSGKVVPLIIAVGALLVLTLTGCGSGSDVARTTPAVDPTVTAPPVGRSDLAEFYSQQPQWRSYADAYDAPGLSERIQTAQITVPVDYDAPERGTTEIVLYRQVAADRSEGAIVMNPGGPGGGGEGLVLDADFIFEPALLDTRDIVAFDPRGVYRSDPIVCRTGAELDASAQIAPGSTENIESAADLGEACVTANPELLAHVDTSNVARDLDVIRSVLGQPRMDYFGFSYGTEIGQRYLQLFPDRAGRIVLDAPVAIDLNIQQLLRGQAEGFEASYQLFVDEYVGACAEGDNECELGRSTSEVRNSIDELVATADVSPIPAGDDRTISGAALTSMLAYSLYDQEGWGDIADILVDAQNGDGAPALELYDVLLEREPDGEYANNSIDAYYAISAADNPTAVTLQDVQTFANELRQVSPLFGASLAWELWHIANWPVMPDAQAPATAEGFGEIPEVLIIGGANDPATPLVWAEATRDLLPGSTLVVWDGVGHTATGTGSACIDDIVTAFMLEGVMPPQGVVCPAQ